MSLPCSDQHANYPHHPGTLYDCPACESACHCDTTGPEDHELCVHCALIETGELAPAAPSDAETLGITVTPPSQRRLPAASAGTVFDGSATRTADELAALVVRYALACGATRQDLPDLDDTMVEVLAFKAEWWEANRRSVLWLDDVKARESGEDIQSGLNNLMYQAIDYLNTPESGVAPDGYAFDLDDGLYLAPIEEF